MKAAYLPPVTHVTPITIVRRDRALPIPGTVTARLNERVQAVDVIAEAETAPRHVFLDLARGLGVPAKEAVQHLVRQKGDRVEAGDTIAGPVGVARRTVRAPADGRVVAIEGHRVLFEVRGEPIGLRAGIPALVVGSDGTQTVTLEVTAALVQGVWGNDKQDFGVIRTLGSGPGARMQTDMLDINLRGAVLIGGTCDQAAPLHQATELMVRGLVLGSITSDLIPAAMRLNYPLMITEGFGVLPMNSAAYGLLTSNVGRDVAIDARRPIDRYSYQRPEIVIPLPPSRQADFPEDIIPLKEGARVRILRAPFHGAVGVVRDLPTKAAEFPSGLLARSADVEIEGLGNRMIPLANLEVIQ
jgi:hypothetical protein